MKKFRVAVGLITGFIILVIPVSMFLSKEEDVSSVKEKVEVKLGNIKEDSIVVMDQEEPPSDEMVTEDQELPELILTVDNSSPAPGDTLNFTAEFSIEGAASKELTKVMSESGAIAGVRLRSGGGVNEFDDTYPYRWSISLPNRSSGADDFQVDTLFGAESIGSNVVSMTVELDIELLHQIYFDTGEPLTMFVSVDDVAVAVEQMSVMGRFTDGYDRNISHSRTGTIYSENIIAGLTITPGDSPVISISEDGLVTALQAGQAEVVATNNGIVNVRRIVVIESDF